jgi:hypothetical protein
MKVLLRVGLEGRGIVLLAAMKRLCSADCGVNVYMKTLWENCSAAINTAAAIAAKD